MENKKKGFRDTLFKNDVQGLSFSVLILLLIGAINVFSSTYIKGIVEGGSIIMFAKHLVFTLLSFIAGWGAYHFDYRYFKRKRVQRFLTAGTLGLLVIVIFFGTVVNGSRRWISLGIISIQPSEFAKLTALLWTVYWIDLERKKKKIVGLLLRDQKERKVWPWISPMFGWPILYALFVLKQPDMGTGVLIVAFSLVPLLLVQIRERDKKYIKLSFGAIPLALVAMIIMEPYRFDRVKAIINPWAYSKDLGYQTVQGLLAVGSGGIFGQGLGQGTSKYFYLPEAHTDFAFAVWAQETGLIGACIVLILFTLFIRYGLRIARHARDGFGSLLAFGITVLIAGQAIFNMFMVCGALPVTGVPLPFISYGGSAQMMNLIAVGILLNIAKRTTLSKVEIGVSGNMPSIREETQSRFRPIE